MNNKDQRKSNLGIKLGFLLLILIAIITIMIIQPYKNTDFVELEENEASSLFEEQQQRTEEPQYGELYVLRAAISKNYPCYDCLDADSLFLFTNEIWKYGVWTEEESEIYTEEYLRTYYLSYFVQFEGTVEECLEQERVKIRKYALLYENLKRELPLIRPPGNEID